MARWETRKSVTENANIGLLTNSRVNKNGCFSEMKAKTSHSELGNLAQVRLASTQEIGPRFAIDVFQSLGHQVCTGQGDTESQPRGVSFPGLQPKRPRKRSPSRRGRLKYEDETDDSDDRRRTEYRDCD
jgi:hypothetical protein